MKSKPHRIVTPSLRIMLVSALAVGCGSISHGEADAGAEEASVGATDVGYTSLPTEAPTVVETSTSDASTSDALTSDELTTGEPTTGQSVATSSELETIGTAVTTTASTGDSAPASAGSSGVHEPSSAVTSDDVTAYNVTSDDVTSDDPSTSFGGTPTTSISSNVTSAAFTGDSTPTASTELSTAPADVTSSEHVGGVSSSTEASSAAPPDTSAPPLETTEGVYTSTSSSRDGEPTVTPSAIDWLNPPSGVPFDLAPEYDFVWTTLDEEEVLDSWYDETECAQTYVRPNGELGVIQCDGAAGNDWSCRCYVDTLTYDWVTIPGYFVDTSFNNGDACRLAAAICLTELPPVNANCYDSGKWPGGPPEYCARDDRCDYHHATPHGEVVESVLLPFVICAVYESPQYYCNGGVFGFDFVGQVGWIPDRSIPETCDVGFQVFFHGPDPGSEGPQTCSPQGPASVEVRDGREQSCSGYYDCRIPATTLGEPIELIYGSRAVTCFESSGKWTCGCEGETDYYTYAGVDGATACESIFTECMSHDVN